MKKLAFLFVAVAAISFAACDGQTEGTESTCDSDSVIVEEVQDTVTADTTATTDTTAVVAE